MRTIQLSQKQFSIVREILSKVVGQYFVFGSRAKGTAKDLSDLDILIKSDISKAHLSELRELFEESNLPFKVDIIVWSEIDDSFKSNIDKDLIKI